MKNTVIIQASSRSNGDSFKISEQLLKLKGIDFIDLNTLSINHYDYDYQNKNDDFNPLATKIADKYDNIIFITPIYWYTMSGLLKVFLDRFSDLIRIHKDTGRKFRGKNVGLISVNNSDAYLKNFSEPIDLSCQYLGMNFKKYLHVPVIDETISNKSIEELNQFYNLF
ncbi:flavodoxin family protein [Urechidicola vernalis]|uniref:NAD(P)H-dependent oxidoreductase n=1 Tax=Urechidicola vernalis TaxID=3075600 RepID=A0ABU2Y3S1_9FLAO|nr:NAD(P)H-dependent oxidoreductase [Urechidicola sp. P050]MDT0552461.1 NAD(P)H-dependent oxidoreductase [Urechidicola sp. P050]